MSVGRSSDHTGRTRSVSRARALGLFLRWFGPQGAAGSIAIASAVALVVYPSKALAQADAPRLRATAQPAEVEVGELFTVHLIALVGQNERAPARPKLKLPAGLALRAGPQIASRTEATLGSRTIVYTGIEATWHVEAQRPGNFRLSPPSVEHHGRVFEANPLTVKVLPRGSKPPTNPRDPFGLLPQLPFPRLPGIDEDFFHPTPAPEPPSDPALALNVAPDSMVFLRALVDKPQAVTGEQVTLSIYQYNRTGSPDAVDVHEPTAPDFFQRQLLQPGTDQENKVAYVGGNPWHAELLRKIALFPLRSGRLEIGPMRASFSGFGLTRGRNATIAARESNPLTIQVGDTPAEGRPVGYRVGDVGRFSLTASVEPRTLEASGALGVTAQLTGIGNLPLTLPVPARAGIEWLEPEVREKIEVQGDRVGGTRTFRYVVRITQPGQVDLGEIALPYYDPERRAYATATASLGRVLVLPSTSPQPSATPVRDPFAALGAVRRTLGPSPSSSTPLSDQVAYWGVLAASPLSVLLFGAGAFLSRRLSQRVKNARESLSRQTTRALREARKSPTPSEAASALERAIHLTIEAVTGLRARGVLREELAGKLEELGVEAALAQRVSDLLARCERVRFEPESSEESRGQLIAEGEELTSKLQRKGKATG